MDFEGIIGSLNVCTCGNVVLEMLKYHNILSQCGLLVNSLVLFISGKDLLENYRNVS